MPFTFQSINTMHQHIVRRENLRLVGGRKMQLLVIHRNDVIKMFSLISNIYISRPLLFMCFVLYMALVLDLKEDPSMISFCSNATIMLLH
jgi:poly(3-hydroxyalkanoate) synthetase